MSVHVDALSTSTVRLRGLDVLIDVDLDGDELDRRHDAAVDLGRYDAAILGALLQISPLEATPARTLSAAARAVASRHPALVDVINGHLLRRRVSPALDTRMITLPTRRWRQALHEIGRFAPYSARRLMLDVEPADLDVLCVEATYWGVGVCVATSTGVREVVHPAPFLPQRYTGASWVFAEQALRAIRVTGTPQPMASSQRLR